MGLVAVWFAEGTFVVSRSIRVDPPMILNDSMPVLADGAEMKIECGPTSSYYVTERGDTMFFNEATGSPEDPHPLCDAARSQRRLTAAGFVLVGLLAGAAVIVMGRVRDRRVAELQALSADMGSQRDTAT